MKKYFMGELSRCFITNTITNAVLVFLIAVDIHVFLHTRWQYCVQKKMADYSTGCDNDENDVSANVCLPF